ncbi:MAG: response regulator [Gemmatimonadetes bacterium]|nr:response regulator [Gemmatimonadota bacterium]
MMREPTVLLVQDNDVLRARSADALSRAGFHVVGAATGLEGVLRARSSMPEVILMSLSMPLIDGSQLVRLLRADRRTRDIPVVALSATDVGRPDPARLQAAGFQGWTAEGTDLRRMTSLVRTLVAPQVGRVG